MNGFLEDIMYDEYYDTIVIEDFEAPVDEEDSFEECNLIIEWMNSNSNKTFDEWYHDKSLQQD